MATVSNHRQLESYRVCCACPWLTLVVESIEAGQALVAELGSQFGRDAGQEYLPKYFFSVAARRYSLCCVNGRLVGVTSRR